jgi:hypothetical protein
MLLQNIIAWYLEAIRTLIWQRSNKIHYEVEALGDNAERLRSVIAIKLYITPGGSPTQYTS